MTTYLQLSNLPAAAWEDIDTGKQLLALAALDDRVTCLAPLLHTDDQGRKLFGVVAKIDRYETLRGRYTGGRIAGTLHCSKTQALANMAYAEDAARENAAREVCIRTSEQIKVEGFLAEFHTTIGHVLRVIDVLKTGRRSPGLKRPSLEVEGAWELVNWNQAHGTGNWFIFTEYKA